MKRLDLLTFIAAHSILLLSPRATFAYNIDTGRPRLYFHASDLPAIRQRITSTHSDAWQSLTTWAQPDVNSYGTYSGRDEGRTHHYIERNAFMYLMLAESNPTAAAEYAQKARNWLMELASYEFISSSANEQFEYLWALSLGYDWLYNWSGFSEADKQAVRDQLLEHTEVQVENTGLDGFPSFPLTSTLVTRSIFDNQATENNLGNVLPGLAIWEGDNKYGTNTRAQRFLDAAYYRALETYKATETQATNGGYWEGQGYAGARYQGEVFFAYIWKVATGEDLFGNNNHMRELIYFWTYGLRPDGQASREGDQTCRPVGCDRNRFIAEILAHRYDDGHAQWYGNYMRNIVGENPAVQPDIPLDWQDIVFYDPEIEVQEPSELPLYRHFKFGHTVIRSGWNIGPSSPDIYFTFSSHDWISNHTHLDVNSFTLFRKGSLAIDSGRYRGGMPNLPHERSYAVRTVAHNTILVYRAGEDFGPYSNDGGQEYIFALNGSPKPLHETDLNDGTRFDTGTLEHLEVGTDYYYMKGNATDAYRSTGFHRTSYGVEAKISNFTRDLVLFVRENPLIVVFDQVSSTKATYPKKWLLHSIGEPMLNGTLGTIEVANHIQNYAADQISMTYGGSRLVSKTLLPSSPNLRKIGGTGYEFWVDDPGQNFARVNDGVANVDVEAGAWRVEVQPPTPALDDTFLHVLYATDAGSTEEMPSVAVNGENLKGVEVNGWVILFSTSKTPLTRLQYQTVSAGTATHLVTGLAAGNYDIWYNGARLAMASITASADGTLKFQMPGPGAATVVPEGETPMQDGGISTGDGGISKPKKDGCGCRTIPSSDSPHAFLAALFFGVLSVRRRLRRRA